MPTFTIRMAIAYAPIAMKATCPKLSKPVTPNWICSPSAKIVKMPASIPTNVQNAAFMSSLTADSPANEEHVTVRLPEDALGADQQHDDQRGERDHRLVDGVQAPEQARSTSRAPS